MQQWHCLPFTPGTADILLHFATTDKRSWSRQSVLLSDSFIPVQNVLTFMAQYNVHILIQVSIISLNMNNDQCALITDSTIISQFVD